MAETKMLKLSSPVSHRMLLVGRTTDALTGEDWELIECPTCGYMRKIQWDPYKNVTLELGEGMLTPEDTQGFEELCKTPAGRLEVSQILARQPGHTYMRVPTEDELRTLATQQGTIAEFEAAVDQAIIAGEPLLTFGIGSQSASTWPKGTGPVK